MEKILFLDRNNQLLNSNYTCINYKGLSKNSIDLLDKNLHPYEIQNIIPNIGFNSNKDEFLPVRMKKGKCIYI